MNAQRHWIDRVTAPFAPIWTLKRQHARAVATLMQRHYEAASVGRRTNALYRKNLDANAAMASSLAYLRATARDLVRNNGDMGSALRTIANHTVGWGIVAKPRPASQRLLDTWKAWAETTACDADGRDDFYGLEKLVIRGVAESGEMLVRRRVRRVEDGLPIPLQIQVMEPDFLDTSKDTELPGGAGRIVHGVEFDGLGRRVAYWLFREHPGSARGTATGTSFRVPASEILHIFQRDRAGQVRAASWFAPSIMPAEQLDGYIDAQLMKQRIAACLAVITSDVDGSAPAVGALNADDHTIDEIQPGAILNVPPGRSVDVVTPPSVSEYGAFVTVHQRRLAKGLGLSYEDYTGDYSQVNFSSARMARLEHWDNVYDWRWRLLVPQFCDPVWQWAMGAAGIMGLVDADNPPSAQWTAPPMPMIEPDKEGLAVMRNVRTGIQTLFEAIRERGYDPEEFLAEVAAGNKKLDELGIVFDSDPRKITQAGQWQSVSDGPAAQ